MTVAATDITFPPVTSTRELALDACRGMAMILVVWGHAMIGVQRAVGADEIGRFAVVMVYAVHMPVFFFLSGLLAHGAMVEPAGAFVRRVASRILWPYVLWSLVLLAAHVRMSGVTNTKVSQFDPLSILTTPPAVMWFLYVLFVALLAARATRTLSPMHRVLVGAVLTVIGYALDGWLLPHLRFLGMFLVATALPISLTIRVVTERRALIVAVIGVGIGAAHALIVGQSAGYPADELVYLPTAAGGIVLLLGLAVAIRNSGIGAVLATVGRHTMPIFVTHILIVAGVRILLLRAGIDDAALIVITATVAGVMLPIAAEASATRLKIARLLGWR